MIVLRVSHKVKRGCVPEFLALLKSRPDSVLSQASKRRYTSAISADSNIVGKAFQGSEPALASEEDWLDLREDLDHRFEEMNASLCQIEA